MWARAALLFLVTITAAVAAQTPESQPRFRGGANLVRVDAYVSANGTPISGLTADDFVVLEDDVPQKVENFEFVAARPSQPAPALTGPTTAGSTREQADLAQDASARVFIIYLDVWHISLGGSFRSPEPIARMLEKVVGPNDLVGIMTPEMSPQNLTLVRRGQGLDKVLRDSWTWGERDRANSSDQRDSDLLLCYPENGKTAGLARQMIERRREQKTLRSLDSTVNYLDTLRDERKFVVLLSEGWVLFGQSDALAAPIAGERPPGGEVPMGPGLDGKVTTAADPRNGTNSSMDSCERERVMLSYVDHTMEVRQLAQRANRANVTFYPVDPRGLTAFDEAVGPMKPLSIGQDRERMSDRQSGLRELAVQTDGAVVLNTNDVAGGIERILSDIGSYYLVSYYSSNAKLDGKFRRITVQVKRDNVEVRARPGYLAPTETEARAMGAALPTKPGMRPVVPPAVSRALDAIAPARGNLPVRIQASGVAGGVRAVVELDATTLRLPEWSTGGRVIVTMEPERGGAAQVMEAALSGGQRSVALDGPVAALTPGRYVVRVEAKPARGTIAVRASTDATVPGDGATLGLNAIALRRGPTTGLLYQPTADPRFRRTERLRIEVPLLAKPDAPLTGRVLTREGQPLPLTVTISERTNEGSTQQFVVAEATLAPLAQGDYVLELAVEGGAAGRHVTAYGFRIIP